MVIDQFFRDSTPSHWFPTFSYNVVASSPEAEIPKGLVIVLGRFGLEDETAALYRNVSNKLYSHVSYSRRSDTSATPLRQPKKLANSAQACTFT